MKKYIFSFLLVLTTALLLPTLSYADCQQVYGGGQVCTNPNISINKLVLNPQTGSFVDNLGVNDAKYAPNSTVSFRLIVTNTGNTSFSHVTVTDTFPQFVSFNSGDGSFNSGSRTLTIGMDNLQAGESRTFNFTTQTATANNLPGDNSTTCVVNQSSVTTNDGRNAQDSAQLCIQKNVLAVTTINTPPQVPATGVETIVLPILLSLFVAGVVLKKKAILR